MRKTQVFFLLCLGIFSALPFSAQARGKNHEKWQNPQNWDNPEITKFLATAPIESCEIFSQENGVYKVKFTDSDTIALFKKGDFLKGEEAEVLAYDLSRNFKNVFVPPVVQRKIRDPKSGEEMSGTLHLFVDHEDLQDKEMFVQSLLEVSQENLDSTKLFCFIMGQWDVHWENFLIKKHDGQSFLVAIDFANIWQCQRGTYGTLPFVKLGPNPLPCDLGSAFPFEEVQNFPYPTFDMLKDLFCGIQSGALESLVKKKKQNNWLVRFNKAVWKQYHFRGHGAFDKDAIFDRVFGLMPAYVGSPSQELLRDLEKLRSADWTKVSSAWIPHCKEHVAMRYQQVLDAQS